ncbi:protein root UVB sensitive 5-like isoform X1 [Mangifera indica]|uniref:protein root UVB sensitive 5-like isoform X1 n=1 Tax=Mangifera indica TaxID=29780 RepID=UPI001CFBD08F|nr:protein root UVB sensitive 5-like isoform X1 [Mangifera indica]
MSYALRLSIPARALESSKNSNRKRARACHLQILSSFSQPNIPEQEEADLGRIQDQSHMILVERYGNGTAKRFILDDECKVQTLLVKHDSVDNRLQGSHFSDTTLSFLPNVVKDFILPAGFPETVSHDYLQYMLLQFPTNVTAWICQALVTSSLLKAVGIDSFSGTTTAISAATIKWVSKDGIGAVGRLFIGGRFGNLFDDDPKQWRMYADFIGSAGSIFDLTTQVYPAYFLPLASLGNLAKAVARGLKDPSFRVIQNHFAIAGNLGEVAAKEEVWEVSAQLLGLALGILILDTPELVRSYPVLALTWLSMRLLHLWLRYQSLSVLQFNSINLKRARILVKSHVSYSTVPGFDDCNKEENILLWEKFMKPRIIFGVPLEEMISGEKSVFKLKTLLRIYSKEKYILIVNQLARDFEVFISFKVEATSMSVLRSVWQTYWLYEKFESSDNLFDQLSQSLSEMEERFDNFIHRLEKAGWDTRQINLKVPTEISIDESS